MLSVNAVLLALALSGSAFGAPVRRSVELMRRTADFGKCSTPEMIFADGLDNRKETSFEPKDLKSYNHGSAQNSGIITQFICDTLINSCGANSDAHTLCQTAQTAAAAKPAKTGDQADAFNAVFGIQTEFASVQPLDDQGNAVGKPSITPTGTAAIAAASVAASPSFGKCSAPEIIFQTGLDNRKETAFEPKDLKSFPHTSAQNINIISQFICDTFTNSCGANAAAKSLCTQAQAAASAAPAKTGAQADAFNAIFGIKTDFAAVQEVDDQGRPVGTPAAATAAATTTTAAVDAASSTETCAPDVTVTATSTVFAAATDAADCPPDVTVTVTAAGATATTAAATATANVAAVSTATSGADFGKCSTPEMIFADGLDNRKETSFEPKDLKSFNHGSAQNSGIISQFICDTLINSCGANTAAHTLCQTAQAAAAAKPAKTGDQADAFNAVFGVTTQFAAVQPIDDQGNPVGKPSVTPTGSAAIAAASVAAKPDFGKCSTPEIIFADNLDNRKETSFEPKDLKSFNHGSAQNSGIIAQFVCDTLINSCGANSAAHTLCQTAQTAAAAKTAKTGAQADAFNAVFGITTNFNAVQPLDDQGRPVSA